MASDLISRDALIKDMYEDGYFPLTVADKATEKVMAQPTVDAVEVVRCKDCKYWGGRHASNECSLITKLGNPDYWLKTLPTDYCSSGVKTDRDTEEVEDICKTTNLPCIKCNPGPCEHRKKG